MFHAGKGPNTSVGNNGIVDVVVDVDVVDVEESGDVDVDGPYGIDVDVDVVVIPGTVVVVVVVVVVLVPLGGSLEAGGGPSVVDVPPVSGGPVVGAVVGALVAGGSVGLGGVGGSEPGGIDAACPMCPTGAGASIDATRTPATRPARRRATRAVQPERFIRCCRVRWRSGHSPSRPGRRWSR